MTKDGDAVQQFIQTQKQVLDFFQCEGDFFIKYRRFLFPFLLDETKQENKCCHSKKKWSTYGLSKKGIYNGCCY